MLPRYLKGVFVTFDLASLGWDADFAAATAAYDARDHQPGRVARVDRGVCTVLTARGPVRASLAGRMLAAGADDPRILPCAGDWVAVRTWPDGRITIEGVLPRRNAIVRTTADDRSLGQVLAANIDTAAVVEPLDPEPDLGRIERLLALAWESGAEPVVLLTKADLVHDAETLAAAVADSAPGAPVHAVSALTGHGLAAAVRPRVGPGRTLALIGPSGSGKSTLVNALAGAAVMITRGLRADSKGRHTTAYRALIPLPDGGAVLDTPGLRAVGLFDTGRGLGRTFADIEALVPRCRFNDCRHGDEPGCAIRAAVQAGEVTPRRLANWRKLQREVAWQERRQDVRLRAEERARWRRIALDHRRRGHR